MSMLIFLLYFYQQAFADQCVDITSTDEFQLIGNAITGKKCSTDDNGKCQIKCSGGFDFVPTLKKPKALCSCAASNCTWSYEDNGTGEGNIIPNFSCCQAETKKQKSAKAKNRETFTFGEPYVEADSTSALLLYKIQNGKESMSAGYTVSVIFSSVLPDDITINTFVRMEVANIFSDESKTFVTFKSKNGFDTLSKGQSFYLSFTMSSSGETDVASFLKNTDVDIKFYKDRHNCHCAGNDDACASAELTKFASFNIQVFGASKYSKTIVKDQIVTILRRYDISTIQEIREASGESFPKLVADMNAQEDIYDSHVGERQGSTSSKEQVGFIWNRNMFSMVDGYDYNDTNTDYERPPSVLVLERVGIGSFSTSKFIIISAHIKPETGASDTVTEDEINKLADVKADALLKHPDVSNVIIAGDFNADCDYVQEPTELTLFTDPLSTFLIGFEEDTTVGATDCAYDHIVVYGDTLPASSAEAGVFNYQEFYDTDNILFEDDPITDLISDHFPVEFSFS